MSVRYLVVVEIVLGLDGAGKRELGLTLRPCPAGRWRRHRGCALTWRRASLVGCDFGRRWHIGEGQRNRMVGNGGLGLGNGDTQFTKYATAL